MVILKRAEISCKFNMTNTTLDKKGFFFYNHIYILLRVLTYIR